jgi:hypothetical protein
MQIKPIKIKRNRPDSINSVKGKKRHGSHRSAIIGKYQFKTKPVTELNQPGIIWQ